jgi:hypothetical protein
MAFCKFYIVQGSPELPTSAADRMIVDNPFVKHDSHHRNTLITYQILSVLSWALVVVAGIYYSIHKPHDVRHGHSIWEQADRHRTPFSQNIYLTGIFWSVSKQDSDSRYP